MIRKLLAATVILGSLYFLLLGGEYTFVDLWRMDREHEVDRAELEAARAEVARLQARVDSLVHDSATLERLAREEYGLIKDGERLYRFVDADSATVAPDPAHVGGRDQPIGGQRPEPERAAKP